MLYKLFLHARHVGLLLHLSTTGSVWSATEALTVMRHVMACLDKSCKRACICHLWGTGMLHGLQAQCLHTVALDACCICAHALALICIHI